MLPVVTVEGRMVADPELRFSPSGVAVGKFRIVAQDRRPNEQNVWEDVGDPLWLQVTCFKQLAENCVESLAKGDAVIVVGKLKTEEWTSESGEKRTATVMIANTVGPAINFRTTPHSESARAERRSEPDAADPWATSSDDPPF